MLRKKACGKTVAELGRQCQEGLLVAADHKKSEEVSTIQERLETKYGEVIAQCQLSGH
jgi:hypothetical protein